MARVTLVAAMARNRVIGRDGGLPWHLPQDLKRFRALTLGKPVVMGRRTYQSIGRPLPGRRNLVVTRRSDFAAPGCELHRCLAAALEACGDGDAMVIGGAEVYAQALPLATRMELTLIDADLEGDTYFPRFESGEWRETACDAHAAGEHGPWPVRYVSLERIENRTQPDPLAPRRD